MKRCGRETGKICVVHIHSDINWSTVCQELRSMCLTCLGLHADIVCGGANQARYFRSQTHMTQRTDTLGKTHPDLLNGLVNAVARLEVAGLNKGSLCLREYVLSSLTTSL